MSILPPNSKLDPCSQWIMDHQSTTFMGDNSTEIELEWLRMCIGPQRSSSTLFYTIYEMSILQTRRVPPLPTDRCLHHYGDHRHAGECDGLYGYCEVSVSFGWRLLHLTIFRNISMRTSTNFFLFSLAVADIAILIMGEQGLNKCTWIFRPFFRGIFWPFSLLAAISLGVGRFCL
jgi:hypothetical protein